MTHNQINFEMDLIKPVREFLEDLDKDVQPKARTSVSMKKVEIMGVKEEVNTISEKQIDREKSLLRRKTTKVLPDLHKLEMYRKRNDE